MQVFRCLPILFAGVIALAGCRSTSGVDEDRIAGVTQPDSSQLYTRAVHVLVDGNDMGITPITLRVRRSFGTQVVALWQAGEEIRTYEIEISSTSEGRQTLQGFWSTPSIDGATFDVRTLPTEGETTYLVPYTPYPIKIEDHEYGVTLLVQD